MKSFNGLIILMTVLVTGFFGVAQAGGVIKYDTHDWVAAQGSNFDLDGDGTWEPSLFAGFDANVTYSHFASSLDCIHIIAKNNPLRS